MAVDTTWTDPSTGGAIDRGVGDVLTEVIYDKILSNLKRLGGTAGLLQVTDAGLLLVNDSANANMTIGETIQQGASDNEAFAIKSTDVAHALTSETEADTYFLIKKAAAAQGGANIMGFMATGLNQGALLLQGVLTDAADTTKSTSGYAPVRLQASINSAGSRAVVGADGNLATIENSGTTRFIFDAEGTLHSIGASQTERFGNGESLLVGPTLTSPIINTPSASGQVYSGTYTPSLTNITNIDSSAMTLGPAQYMRVGQVVTVSGYLTINATNPDVVTVLGMSLPIASDLAGVYDCCGTGMEVNADQSSGGNLIAIHGDATNNRAEFYLYPGLDATTGYVFHFTYLIV